MTRLREGRRKAMILEAFDRVQSRGREIAGHADRIRRQHQHLTAALADLFRDERLQALLAEEHLDTLPMPICERIEAIGRSP